MSTRYKTFFFYFIILSLSLVASDITLAEDKAKSDATAASEISVLASKSDELLSQLNELQEQLTKHRNDIKKATGEDRALTATQISSKTTDFRELLNDLVANLKQQEEDGLDTSALTKQLKRLVDKESLIIHNDIIATENAIDELRKDREQLSPEDMFEREQQIAEQVTVLDSLIKELFQNTEHKLLLGLEARKDLELLDERLDVRATSLAGLIELTKNQISKLKTRMAKASDSDQQSLDTELTALNEKMDSATASLRTLVAIMEKRGLDTALYSQLLVQVTGEITGDVFDKEVIIGLINQWYNDALDWLLENGPGALLNIIIFFIILVVFKLLSKLVGRVVKKAVTTSKLSISQLLQEFFISASSKAVMLVGVLVALSQLGVQIAPLLAGLGVLGFIIGFALQDTLSNFASGMMILLYRPYDIGDVIEASGVTGKVQQMSLVSTTVLTFDNQKLIIPNNKIWGDVIRNVTSQHNRRVDLTFGIGYDDNIEHAEKILWEIINGHELVLRNPEPVIKLHVLGESSVDFIVRPWTRTEDYWTVYWDVTRKVKERFDVEGISIPFPQRDVHVFNTPPSRPMIGEAK